MKIELIQGVEAQDSFELDISKRKIDPATGFLSAPASIARTGVQLYRARELGLDKHGIAGDRIIKLHRPPEELFNPETMATFDGAPIINSTNHQTVTADNWHDLAVGDIHAPAPGSNTLDVGRFVVRDKSAVDDINNGKKYLSIGYKFDLDLTPGVTATGDSYDGIQRQIKGNHVLITDSPRGGPACSIADSAEELSEGERKMKTIIIDSIPVEVGDKEAAVVETLVKQRDDARNIQPSIKVGDKTITGADAIQKELTDRDNQIAELKKQIPSAEQINALATERARVLGDALKLDADFKADDKATNKQIMVDVLTKVAGGDAETREMVTTMLGGKTIGDASDELLAAAFRTIAAGKKVATTNSGDRAVAAALTSNTTSTTAGDSSKETKLVGREAFVAAQQKAWQK
jgi:hypothetical protein